MNFGGGSKEVSAMVQQFENEKFIINKLFTKFRVENHFTKLKKFFFRQTKYF
jgi:hypothetical protein